MRILVVNAGSSSLKLSVLDDADRALASEAVDAPVGRIGALDTWIGYSPSLENEILPQVENIVEEAQRVLAY